MVFGAGALWLDNPYLDMMVRFSPAASRPFSANQIRNLPQYLKREEVIAGKRPDRNGNLRYHSSRHMFGDFLVLETGGRQVPRAP